MARTLKIQGRKIDFPPACVQCGQPAQERYRIDRTFIYGRRAVLIDAEAPLCPEHYQQARAISPVERWSGRFGLGAGALAGAGTLWGLLNYWTRTGQGLFLLNALIALPVAVGIFLSIWVGTLFWIAPRFASAAAKTTRSSVQLSRYEPLKDQLEITFQNEQVADLAARLNAERLADDPANLRRYHIRAALLCHDVRLNTRIEAEIEQAYPPTEEEARKLLWPLGDQVVADHFCEDCPYDIYGVSVELAA